MLNMRITYLFIPLEVPYGYLLEAFHRFKVLIAPGRVHNQADMETAFA